MQSALGRLASRRDVAAGGATRDTESAHTESGVPWQH